MSEGFLEAFYAQHPTPSDNMRIPLASFIENPEESLVKAQKYLEEEGAFGLDVGRLRGAPRWWGRP